LLQHKTYPKLTWYQRCGEDKAQARVKEKSPKIVGKRQKDQWITHPSSNSPRVKSKQRTLSEWCSEHFWWPKDHFNGKSGSKGENKDRCLVCNEFGCYARECLNGRKTSLDDDNNHSKDIFNDQRNDR